MKRTYVDFVGDYYDRQDSRDEEENLKVFDQGQWVSLQTFFKERG